MKSLKKNQSNLTLTFAQHCAKVFTIQGTSKAHRKGDYGIGVDSREEGRWIAGNKVCHCSDCDE